MGKNRKENPQKLTQLSSNPLVKRRLITIFISLQGICSAYDIVVICEVEPFYCFGLRKNENSSQTDEQTNGSTRVIEFYYKLS